MRRPALVGLGALALLLIVPGAATARRSPPGPGAGVGSLPQAYLVVVDGLSFEDALADPEISGIAAAGGIGLLPAPGSGALRASIPDTVRVLEVPAGEGFVDRLQGREVLVIVAAPEPTAAMAARGDDATPLVMARGAGGELGDRGGEIAGLTSDSTRRSGIVAAADVGATFRAFLGAPSEAGARIRIEGLAPVELHERYLEVRRVRFPLQVGALGFALALLLALLAFPWRGRGRTGLARVLGVWALASAALPAALLLVSVLPEITPVTGLAATLLLTAGAVWAARRSARRDPVLAIATVGVISLAVLVLDGARGWEAMAMPVLGGGALDGARFFGLGNAYAGVLLGAALVVAPVLGDRGGFALLLGGSALAGLPWAGANLGGGLALLTAAALWAALRLRRGAWWLAATVAIGGVAALVGAHALSPLETHVTRSVADGSLLGALGERLRINVRVTGEIGVGWLVPVALAGGGWLALRRWGALARDPGWRDACLILAFAGLAGFAVNDTGIAVGGLALFFLLPAIAYPTLSERWNRT